jgi:hypothetical protein
LKKPVQKNWCPRLHQTKARETWGEKAAMQHEWFEMSRRIREKEKGWRGAVKGLKGFRC